MHAKEDNLKAHQFFMLPHFDVAEFFLFFCGAKFFLQETIPNVNKKSSFKSESSFFYPPDSCQIPLLAPFELQPTFISILDVYQRRDPVSATQDYSSASFPIQQRKKKTRGQTRRGTCTLTFFFTRTPELIPFRANLINHQRWQF